MMAELADIDALVDASLLAFIAGKQVGAQFYFIDALYSNTGYRSLPDQIARRLLWRSLDEAVRGGKLSKISTGHFAIAARKATTP